MLGIIFALLAGLAMSVQGVFNSRLSEKLGLWETNTLVQGSAFVIVLIITFIFGKGSFSKIGEVNKLYLTGGLIGIFITFSVMMSMTNLGPTYAVSIILIAQLITAALIDLFGLFETTKVPFSFSKIIGVIIMIIGIIIFKWKS